MQTVTKCKALLTTTTGALPRPSWYTENLRGIPLSQGFSQQAYCKIMEVIGGHDSSTAVFVNAHHSIGIRALLLFGAADQKKRWLPGLVNGTQLAAFALTEEQAGSDAANVQTTATPTPDGSAYVLNGEKRYITNGGIAGVLTVMARTPVPGSSETKVAPMS